MNFPLISDLNFIKNLKENDKVYLVSTEWNPDDAKMIVKAESLTFKSFETKTKVYDKDNTTILGNLTSNGKNMEKHNLYFGFYATPLDALKSFKKFSDCLSENVDNAIKEEEDKLNKNENKN